MLRRRQVLYSLDILWPVDTVRKLRSRHNKPQLWQLPCRLDQQPLKGWLPVVAVRAHVTHVPSDLSGFRKVDSLVRRAIKRAGRGRGILLLNEVESGSARKREIHVIPRDQLGRDVLVIAAL